MNPFLHDTVARPLASRADIPAAPAGSGIFRRMASQLALAGSLGLAAAPVWALDVNTADAAQLEGLRGIGPRMAQIILQERQRGGPFESMEDMSDRVRGIGPKRAKALQEAGLTVGKAPQTLSSQDGTSQLPHD